MSLEIFNKGSKLLTSKQPVDAPLIFEAGDIDGIKIEQSVISADDLDSGSFNETGQRVVPQAFIGQGNMVDDDDLETPDVKEERDYKEEYKKYGSSTKSKKYRAELNQYNRKKGTYGNGDGKDASHKG